MIDETFHLGHHNDTLFNISRSSELLARWMAYSAFADSAFRSHPGTIPAKSAQVYDSPYHMGLFARFTKIFALFRAAMSE